MFRPARLVWCRHRPRRRRARPGGLRGLRSEVDLAVGAVLARGFHHVFADDRAVAHDLESVPRTELESETAHVRIRADARITKQIPGAADRLAAFEDREALVGALAREAAGHADAGQAGSSEERRVGKEGVSTCNSRWSTAP